MTINCAINSCITSMLSVSGGKASEAEQFLLIYQTTVTVFAHIKLKKKPTRDIPAILLKPGHRSNKIKSLVCRIVLWTIMLNYNHCINLANCTYVKSALVVFIHFHFPLSCVLKYYLFPQRIHCIYELTNVREIL